MWTRTPYLAFAALLLASMTDPVDPVHAELQTDHGATLRFPAARPETAPDGGSKAVTTMRFATSGPASREDHTRAIAGATLRFSPPGRRLAPTSEATVAGVPGQSPMAPH